MNFSLKTKTSLLGIFGGLAALSCFAVAAPEPDFVLTDLNPNSERAGDSVSPRDYLHQVSAYYFGASE